MVSASHYHPNQSWNDRQEVDYEADPPDDRRPAAALSAHGRPSVVRIALALGVLALLGIAIAWLGGSESDQTAGAIAPPVIEAEPGPVKERPEDPGGLEITDRDKLVYRRFSGDADNAPAVERLLPRHEEPKPVPRPAARTAPTPAPADTADPYSVEGEDPIAGLIGGTDMAGDPAGAPPTPPRAAAAPALGPQSPAPVPTETVVASADVHYVQVAAVRSSEAATAEWKRISSRHADLLGTLDLQVASIDLGDRGTYFRVRAGPVASKDRAKALCAELSARKVGCLVIQPNG